MEAMVVGRDVCGLALFEHDSAGTCADPLHAKALEARRAGAPPWSALKRRDEGINGWRDYLDGEAIHCGVGLELQSVVVREDDYGSFALKLPAGVPVRYEMSGEHVVQLSVAGAAMSTKQDPGRPEP